MDSPNNTIQRILQVEVLNDEMGDYEVQQNQKTSVKLALLLTTPNPTACSDAENKCNIDTVLKKTQTLGNMLKHSSRALVDKFNQQHTDIFGQFKRKMETRIK